MRREKGGQIGRRKSRAKRRENGGGNEKGER